MLPNNKYSVAQCEPLIGVIGYRGVESSVRDRDARRRGDDPTDVPIVSVPQFDAEGQSRRDVVKVGIAMIRIPFVIDDREMRQSTTIVTGLVMDRTRLLMPGRDGERWAPDELERQIDKWIKPLVKKLPQI
jgi:hypothetical protein